MRVVRMDPHFNAPIAVLPRTAAARAPSALDLGSVFARFATDDYILLAIIAALIFEGCDDYILLAALGYLFIVGL